MMPQHHPFVKVLARSLRQRCDVATGSRVLVAVSGGADSVALLRGLAAIAPRRGWALQLTVAHVQHHLRDTDEAAEGDAAFVAALAESLGLPCVRADLDALSLTARGNVEANARRARYAALFDLAQQADCPIIATAHHGDDQLETMLMRLLRGSAVRGLAGMAWRRRLATPHGNDGTQPPRHLVRPMLLHDRAAVVSFLSDLNQPWREDHTNADVTRSRARLRHEVLPVLHALYPSAARRATQTADHLRGVAHLLETTARQSRETMVQQREGMWRLDRQAARMLSPVVLVELLRMIALEAGARPDQLGASAIEPIARAVSDHQGGTRCFALSAGVMVEVTRTAVTLHKR